MILGRHGTIDHSRRSQTHVSIDYVMSRTSFRSCTANLLTQLLILLQVLELPYYARCNGFVAMVPPVVCPLCELVLPRQQLKVRVDKGRFRGD